MLRRLRDRFIIWNLGRKVSKEDLEAYLLERVERLWEDWNHKYCSCDCHVDRWWREWDVYNDHVLRAAAEWGVDQYTFVDGNKRKVIFSEECLRKLEQRDNENRYHLTGSSGPR